MYTTSSSAIAEISHCRVG